MADGTPRHDPDHRPDIRRDPRLGKMSDLDLGRLTGWSTGTVYRARVAMGIEAYRPRRTQAGADPADIDWSRADWSLPNRDIADALGVTVPSVRRKRIALGVAPVKREPVRKPLVYPASKRHLLGTMYDREVEAITGVHRSTVALERRRLGIEAFGPSKMKPARSCPRPPKLESKAPEVTKAPVKAKAKAPVRVEPKPAPVAPSVAPVAVPVPVGPVPSGKAQTVAEWMALGNRPHVITPEERRAALDREWERARSWMRKRPKKGKAETVEDDA